MRNPTALAFQPGSGDLYAIVQERDGLGDGLVPDYLTRVQEGGFYGWPYGYIGPHPQPGFAQLNPEKVKATLRPDVLFEAHSSLLDLVFYEGDQFPADFKGDAFVALRGLRVYRSRVRRSLKSSDTRVIKYQHEPPRQLGAVTEERHLRRGRIRVAKPKL